MPRGKSKPQCTIPDCTSLNVARGMCALHYQRWKKYGDPLRERPTRGQPCSISSCDGLTVGRGWCKRHYYRWRRTGSLELPTLLQHIETKLRKDGPIPPHRPDLGPCWIWLGYSYDSGRPARRINGRKRFLYRVLYELLIGPIPEGLVPDHLCRNPRCPNPWHLEWVTVRENILRGDGYAASNARKTRCPRGHEFDLANTYWYPDGRRRGCRQCIHDWGQFYAGKGPRPS
jgi:hypothetical protein